LGKDWLASGPQAVIFVPQRRAGARPSDTAAGGWRAFCLSTPWHALRSGC